MKPPRTAPIAGVDFRSQGSLAEWLRQSIVASPGITVEELVAMSSDGPRHWRARDTDSKVIARGAIRRIAVAGEIEVVDGKIFPTRRLRVSPTLD